MPHRTVTWHRWQVAVAFVAITVAYVLGLYAIEHQRTVARRETVARIKALQDVADKSCRSRHKLARAEQATDTALNTYLSLVARDATTFHLTPQQRVGLARLKTLNAHLRRAHKLARQADCAGVKPLPGLSGG